MGTKYHVNKKGAVGVCRAEKECPFGENNSHYKDKEDAQLVADVQNEMQHGGLFTGATIMKPATTEKEMEYVALRMNDYKEDEIEQNTKHYYSRSHSSEAREKFNINPNSTKHYRKDRLMKEELIREQVGEGNVLSYYKVNHMVKHGKFGDQMVEVYDTGQIKIYDVNDGKIVTTFIPAKERMEIMMLRAGHIPNKEWLDEVGERKKRLDKAWAVIEKQLEKEKKADRESEFSPSDKENELKKNQNKGKKVNKEQANKGHQSKPSTAKTQLTDKNKSTNRNNGKKKPVSKPKKKEVKYNKHGIPIG